jgi:SAM-dependent methyltransferase
MTDPHSEKAALRGEPSYVWRSGQARRLNMILREAGDYAKGKILDVGCGIGLYLQQLASACECAFGVELDLDRARMAKSRNLIITCATGENLPYPSNNFDLILSHEVLEHVEDDRACLEEIIRILRHPNPGLHRPGGRLVLFVPNRSYPFETHGIYWHGKYHFGNIPLVNYLPSRIRDRLAPHVRAYRKSDLVRLFEGLPIRLLHQSTIFGAYDNIIARWPVIGRALRAILQSLERTPLKAFGLSHFWVVERTQDEQTPST